MKVTEYNLVDDENLGSFVDGITAENIILNDYFYFTDTSFATSQNIYSDKQVGRILSVTDREYFELIQKYSSQEVEEQIDQEKLDAKKRIDEINAKIDASKKYEESSKKITEIEKNLEQLEKDLKSYDELDSRIQTSTMDLQTYQNLSKFNLQKIHDDLVNINRQIDQYEEDLISKKIVEIKESKNEYVYDSGKIGLASGIAIGIAIFGGVFYLINAPFWLPLVIWGIAVIVFVFMTIFSKVPKGYSENLESGDYSPSDVNAMLANLKAQRDAILQFVGVRSTNDFFLMKAKFSSAKKNVDFMLEQKKGLAETLDLEKTKQDRDKLRIELNELKSQAVDSSSVLKSDEYLELYRELDSLKLKLGNNINSALTKKDIPNRLKEIRKELSDKLPSYAGVLKSTFERSFDKILEKAKSYSSSINFTNNLSEWESMGNYNRFLVLLSLAQEVYVQNFAFILEEVSNWTQEEINLLKKFIEENKEQSFDLYVIDAKKFGP